MKKTKKQVAQVKPKKFTTKKSISKLPFNKPTLRLGLFVIIFASLGAYLLLKIFANPIPLVIPALPASATSCSELSRIAFASADKVEVTSTTENSIGKAVQNAKSGSFVIVRGANAGRNYPLQSLLSKRPAVAITVLAADGEQLSVDGFNIASSSNIKVACFKNLGHIHIKSSAFIGLLSNILPAGGKTTDFCKSTNKARIAFCEGSNNSTIQNNTIVGGTRLISLYGGSSVGGSFTIKNITLDGNILSGNGTAGQAVNGTDDAIQVYNANGLYFSRNKITNLAKSFGCQDYNKNGSAADDPCHNDGMQILESQEIVLRNNEFTWPEGDGTGDQAILIQNNSGRVYIANNLCYKWVGSCLTLAGVAEADVVNNTLIASENRQGIFLEKTPHPRSVRMWNNIISRLQVIAGAPRPTFESHNIVATNSGGATTAADPSKNLLVIADLSTLFINTDATSVDRFLLKTGVSAIDSGLQRDLTPITDFVQYNRDINPDRGAREAPPVRDTQAPTAPTSLRLTQISGEFSVRITWVASSDNVGIAQYKIYRIDPNTTTAKLVGNVSGLQFTNKYLEQGKTYKYYIVAVDTVGNQSVQSTQAQILIK